MPPLQSGWAVQRYDDRTKSWQTIIDATQGGFCRSLLSTDVETKYLEPGSSMKVMSGGALGVDDAFKKGDLARMIVFREVVPRGDWKSAIPSVPFRIEDDLLREKDGSIRMKY